MSDVVEHPVAQAEREARENVMGAIAEIGETPWPDAMGYVLICALPAKIEGIEERFNCAAEVLSTMPDAAATLAAIQVTLSDVLDVRVLVDDPDVAMIEEVAIAEGEKAVRSELMELVSEMTDIIWPGAFGRILIATRPVDGLPVSEVISTLPTAEMTGVVLEVAAREIERSTEEHFAGVQT